MYDQVNLIPITRTGMTATPLQLDYDGRPSFLIDASVFPGSSGSPVFVYKSGKLGAGITTQDVFVFVGVVAKVASIETGTSASKS